MAWSKKNSESSNYDDRHEYNALEARGNTNLADNFYYNPTTTTDKDSSGSSSITEQQSELKNVSDNPENKQLAVVVANNSHRHVINLISRINGEDHESYENYDDDEDNEHDDNYFRHQRPYKPKSLIDYSWSKKILEMVGNKAKLVESFSWLSTVGGGFSALGEKDSNFSMRAGSLSLGQQLQLAELLGDDRLKVMCHLFAALAALQLDNKLFCFNYMRRVAVPLLFALPYRDPILMNMVKHIFFRLGVRNLSTCKVVVNAIKDKSEHKKK